MTTRTTLGEIVDIYDKKRVPLNSRERAERRGPYPYYGAQGVIDYIDGYLFEGRYLLVPEDGENLNSRKLPIAFFATGRFWVNNHAHILLGKPGRLDTDYLSYWLNNADVAGYVTGAAQPKLSQANLCRMEIDLPKIDAQIAIARFLRSYDDLIENNTRRIAILEEMARRIFEEWFVHFRAPGCEGLPLVESPIGPIPQGWEVKKLGDVLDLKYGKALKADDREVGPYPVYGSSGVVGTHSTALIQGPGIIVGRKGNVGSVHWSDGSFYPIDTVFFVATTLPKAYVFHLLKRQRFLNSDAAVPGLNRAQALAIRFASPSTNLPSDYAAIVEPIFKLLDNIARANTNLRAQRDLLLPKLISGEIDVSAEAKRIPEAAE